jgi:hypothetical protein
MISLLYLLGFFANGEIKWLKHLDKTDPKYYERVGILKREISIRDLCYDHASILEDYAVEVFKLSFTDEPPYQKLKFILIRALLDLSIEPSIEFDWTLPILK